MTEASPPPLAAGQAPDAAAAGALLRAARQQQGLHVAALAAAIKVTPAKLEALEAGRLHELPDATFARALAQTVCRALKTDPAPVLALMPGSPPDALGRVDGGLNAPFRERPGRVLPTDLAGWAPWRHPVVWLVGLLLLAAAAFVLVPTAPPATEPVLPAAGTVPAPEPAASAPDAGTAPVPPSAEPASAPSVAAAPASAPAPGSAAAPAPAPAAEQTLVLRATEASWVQAVDANGQTLIARLVPAGETVALTPALPVRLRIGNARGTELQFRGQPVVLSARDNIANLTLP